jgi:hypothetical protein
MPLDIPFGKLEVIVFTMEATDEEVVALSLPSAVLEKLPSAVLAKLPSAVLV